MSDHRSNRPCPDNTCDYRYERTSYLTDIIAPDGMIWRRHEDVCTQCGQWRFNYEVVPDVRPVIAAAWERAKGRRDGLWTSNESIT